MFKKLLILFVSVQLFFTLSACSTKSRDKENDDKSIELTISAAISLNEALTEIQAEFTKKHPNIHTSLNLAGSGTLQQQIIQGAPVDIFISASSEKFTELEKRDLLIKQSKKNLLSNELVLISNKTSKANFNKFEDLTSPSIKKIAIGTPESVPAGMYARQSLEKLGIWDEVEEKILYAKDVRQVLTYVETGNVDAGIVYMTEAKSSEKVKIITKADPATHDQIIYPSGIINSSKHVKEANLFYDFLTSAFASEIFKKYGFKVLD
ncbi:MULTISPECIES: molybdate ABC transporter substrate-binding protein [unclassified Bacillus (in: firmicutes)]|uniref:molybdate ABC transporter substrate-binding protein n=1 Tax=unclassified Bacillus (in: firmicutes) TaxID=185979 RepID=UPI0008DF52A7|nr:MULTISPECIES: molybdate ABC transporter substrate-binding protein [unclassified Bacillus (in: firmicutes)]SFA91335.1 molybdate transport system substrate-binding protein [Bacillus sp. UNCCL13]SFQ85556.1 molybdate transport system substrate-binding protein [Bacillus sp. cl95]